MIITLLEVEKPFVTHLLELVKCEWLVIFTSIWFIQTLAKCNERIYSNNIIYSATKTKDLF